MAQAIPVNNNILKWARETSGLSVVEVADKLKKTIDVIEDWEKGVSSPTYSQLETLAYKVYKRPIVAFFLPAIPKESSPKAEFRTLPEEVVDTMPQEIIKVYKRAKVYQLNLKELDNQNEAKVSLLLDNFELKKASNIPNLTKSIRSFLKIDIQTQLSWKNFDEGIESWRDALVNCGIYIFKDAFKNDLYSGLSLYDENYPVILINNSMAKSRQIFTIFHEVGHLLFKAGGVDVIKESFDSRLHSDYYAIEQKCNEFAGEFLLPATIFQGEHLIFTEENAAKLAHRFKVSREVILRKYLNLNLISPEMYKLYTGKWLKECLDLRQIKRDQSSGGDYYNTKKAYLGKHYINLVFSHYYRGKIDTETLADYLDIKVSSVSTLEGYIMR